MRSVYVLGIILFYLCFSRTAAAQSADPALDSMKSLLQSSEADTHKVLLLSAIAVKYSQTDPHVGIDYAKEGLKLSAKLNYVYGQVKSNNIIGRCYAIQNDYPNALKHFHTALEDARKMNSPFIMATLLVSVGAIYTSMDEVDKALKYLMQARVYYKQAGTKNTVSLITNIGYLYNKKENYDESLSWYLEGIRQAEATGELTEDLTSLYSNAGSTYLMLQNYTDGLQYLFKALKLTDSINNDKTAAHALSAIGDGYLRTVTDKTAVLPDSLQNKAANLAKAQYYLQQAEKLCKHLGIKDVLLTVYNSLTQVSEQTGNYKAAYLYHKEYMAVHDSLKNITKEKEFAKVEAEYLFLKKTDSLKYENGLKDKALKQRKLERNSAILLTTLAAIVSILLINRQKLRHREKSRLAEAENKRIKLLAAQQLDDFTKNIQEKNDLIEKFSAEIERYQSLPCSNELPGQNDVLSQLQQSVLLTEQQWEEFKNNFEKVHAGFLNRLRQKFPDLTPAETRFMVLSKLQFSNKEMAAMLGVTLQGVRNYKYRLLKKQGLSAEATVEELLNIIG